MAHDKRNDTIENEPKDVYASDLDFEDFPRKGKGKKRKGHFDTQRIDDWEVLEDERQVVANFFL